MKSMELTPQDIENILKANNDFFDTQKTKSLDFRIEELKKLRAGIEKYESRIFAALKMDFGKSEFESYTTEIGFLYKH